ncbi:MAG: hypothetical protein SCM11_17825 [Bacillota bacterium]|nr:hypothetical protein [Bacillota bacterium]
MIPFPVRSLDDPVWTPVGQAGFTANGAYSIALELDSSGNPYILFADDANDNKATVMIFNGVSWELVGPAGFSADSVSNAFCSLTMAFDSSDTLYVAYRDISVDDKATVMRFNGASWETVGPVGFTAGGVQYLFLAIDGQDKPYVAFQDEANSNKASVMMFNEDSWTLVGPAGISEGIASFTTLDFDSSHNPYLAYRDSFNSDGATVQKYTSGEGWQVLGSEAFSPGEVNFPVIQLNQLDVPYLAFADRYNGSEATVMYFNGSIWQLVGDPALSTGISFSIPWYLSLKFDQANNPYITYAAQRIYAFYYDGSWHELGELPLVDVYSDFSAMDIADDGTVYVAFTDGGNADKATVMSFAAGVQPTPTPTPTEAAPTPTPTLTPTGAAPTPTPTDTAPTPTPVDDQETNPQTGTTAVSSWMIIGLFAFCVLILILSDRRPNRN